MARAANAHGQPAQRTSGGINQIEPIVSENPTHERGTARVEPRIAPSAPHPEARVEEHTDPRPHRVELPHVAEVAEAREARAALAEDREGHPEVEARGGEAMRSLADEDPDHDGPGGREHGRDAERSP